MRILVSYRGIPQSPDWATGDMVVKAFRALGHDAFPYAKYYQENRWVDGRPPLDKHDWDLILFMECNDGEPQYHELALARARKTACWLFDTSYYADRLTPVVKYFRFNHIFLANPLTIQEYKVWGYENVHYLPYACDPELHSRSLDHPRTRDVVLVGSDRPDRRALVDALKKRNVNIEFINGVFREEYMDALGSSRIVVNQNPLEGRGLLNMRHFEAQAASTLLLEQWRDLKINMNAGLDTSAGCIHTYESADDIADLCESFLKYKEDLTVVMDYAKQEFFAYHTYENRCQQIIDTMFPNERN
jgi:spore maturation protein CgeB